MVRKDFLILCRRASIWLSGKSWHEAKDDWPEEVLVTFRGDKYVPLGYKASFKKGELIHSAELRDIDANETIVYAPLDEVKPLKE